MVYTNVNLCISMHKAWKSRVLCNRVKCHRAQLLWTALLNVTLNIISSATEATERARAATLSTTVTKEQAQAAISTATNDDNPRKIQTAIIKFNICFLCESQKLVPKDPGRNLLQNGGVVMCVAVIWAPFWQKTRYFEKCPKRKVLTLVWIMAG